MAGTDGTVRAALLALSITMAVAGGVAAFVVGGDDDTQVTAGRARMLDDLRDWQVNVLNGDVEATDDAVRQRYSAAFLAAVPPSTFRRGAESLRPLGPWRLGPEIERRGDDVLATQLLGGGGEEVRLTILRGPDGRIDASTVLRAVPCADATDPTVPIATPLADRLAWALGTFRAGADPTDDELTERLAPTFLAELPVAEVRDGLGKIRALGPFRFRSYEGAPLATSLVARLGLRTGEEARLTLGVEPDAPHRITSLTVLTQPPCRTGPAG